MKHKLDNNVKSYRVWRGIKQIELAHLCNIGVSTIRNIERKKYVPRLVIRIKLSQFFGVSLEQLFFKYDDDNN